MKAIASIPECPPVIKPVRRPILSTSVVKEVRVLLPVWLVTLAVPLLIAWQWRGHAEAIGWAWAVTGLGCVIMAALSVGHEFNHRTVTLLLVQPVPRKQLWRHKQVVLGCAFLTAAALAWWVAWKWEYYRLVAQSADLRSVAVSVWAGGVCAFFATPWLTMVSRHTLGGIVFSLALPMFSWSAITQFAFLCSRLIGIEVKNEASVMEVALWLALTGWGLAGLVLGRRRFLRLEAIDGPGTVVEWPGWLESITRKVTPSVLVKEGGWFGSLVRKELRLQQLPIGLCVLFCVVWLVQMAANRLHPRISVEVLSFQGMAFAAVVALLSGALGCAEERNAGTLEWHLTLPVSVWKQWLVKCLVTLGLAVLMGGIVVPATMAANGQLGTVFSHDNRIADALVLGSTMVWVASVSLHASSVSRSTATAVMLALAGATCWTWSGMGLGIYFGEKNGPMIGLMLLEACVFLGFDGWASSSVWRHAFPLWAFVLPTLLNVVLAYSNFRQLNPTWRRYLLQWVGLALPYFLAGWLRSSLQHIR